MKMLLEVLIYSGQTTNAKSGLEGQTGNDYASPNTNERLQSLPGCPGGQDCDYTYTDADACIRRCERSSEARRALSTLRRHAMISERWSFCEGFCFKIWTSSDLPPYRGSEHHFSGHINI